MVSLKMASNLAFVIFCIEMVAIIDHFLIILINKHSNLICNCCIVDSNKLQLVTVASFSCITILFDTLLLKPLCQFFILWIETLDDCVLCNKKQIDIINEQNGYIYILYILNIFTVQLYSRCPLYISIIDCEASQCGYDISSLLSATANSTEQKCQELP